MSDNIKSDRDNSKQPLDDAPLESRRKFTKTGLAGSAVLMTLINRPALAHDGNECTASILASGNLSAHPGQDECRFLGCSPGFWKHLNNQPGGNAWQDVDTNSPIHAGSPFTDPGAFGPLSGTDVYSNYLKTHSLIEVINATDFPTRDDLGLTDNNQVEYLKSVGLHAVAALANSYHSLISTMGSYPSTATVQSDFVLVAYSTYIACLSGSNGDIKSCKGSLSAFVEAYDEYGDNPPNRTCPLGSND